MTNLNQATILLTGATGGFGQALTRLLLEKNGRLILTDHNAKRLADVAESSQTAASPGKILAAITANLSTEAGAAALFEAVTDLNTPLDVLVNNAGLAVVGRHDEVPPDRWEQLIQVNLLAPMRLCAYFIPQMVSRKKGHIVNISSIAGWVGPGGMASYAASKFGLRGFSESLMDELSPHQVHVTAVYPYFSRTPIIDAERHGSLMNRRQVPDSELTDPADIMGQVVRAIETNQQHLFPDRRARQIHALKRYAPALLKWLTDRRFG